MIEVQEALRIIEGERQEFGVETVPLQHALGRVLAEAWHTDRDLPPYDRVTMDGIAIQYEQFKTGQRSFQVEQISAAGMPQAKLNESTACIEVMTGGVCPEGADVIIRYEDVQIEQGVANVLIDEVKRHQNIHFKGQDRTKNSLVVPSGKKISPSEIAVGASIGKTFPLVYKMPKIAVISTGDELVEIEQIPQDHQIRRSNVYAIQAYLKEWGIESDGFHLLDNKDQLKLEIEDYLNQYDAIILSGGVSKGKYDFLPQIFKDLGVEKKFHGVKQRPGKPFWFGVRASCTVFALPGNPISSFLCMQKYFSHWLHTCIPGYLEDTLYAELSADVHFKPDLQYFLEVALQYDPLGKLIATPKKGNGSGDLANLVLTDAFIELPKGPVLYKKGSAYPLIKYRN